MWWRPSNIGYGIELTHAKAYAPAAEMPPGFTRLEFTDGHNIVTANVMKRWPNRWRNMTPYAGAGIGLAIPHVDITEGANRTYGYQVTGPAAKLIAGVKYDLNQRWAVFTEYQFSYTKNDVDLAGGGNMKMPIITNALNVGVAVKF
jgi:lipid A oxidase